MKICFPVILAAICCSWLPSDAPAQDKVIRFGSTEDYPPFAQRAADGTLIGGDVTIARRIAKSMKARAEFVKTSWASLLDDFAARKFDVVIGGLTVLPERAAVGTFSVPLMDDGKRPLALCENRARYTSIAAINRPGVRVEISRGPAIIELAKIWFPQASISVHPEDATLTTRLLEKESDVWVADGVVADHMARRYPGKLCATTAQPFTHLTKAWLIRNDPALIAAVNNGLTKALRNGSWIAALHAVP
ncbi:MAG: transporter substrate-binding domain-containing protein [Sphingobium sp.]